MKRAVLNTAAAAVGVTGVLVASHFSPMAAGASQLAGSDISPSVTSPSTKSPSTKSHGLSTPSPSRSGASSSPPTNQTVTGDAFRHEYGPVQVQIVVSQGAITDISLVQQPPDGHSRSINSRAVPVLVSEALKAQSASVHGVSGATLTSKTFMSSLASAIQKAGL